MKKQIETIGLLWVLVVSVFIFGCSETPEPITAETKSVSTLAEAKMPAVAAAPQAPNVGRPFVKEVGYYTNWKLTKEIKGNVVPGKTIFVKVVFSEPMKHTVADDKKARPIFYYKVDGKLTQFRVVERKARDEDFVSGDMKPQQCDTKLGTYQHYLLS